MRVAQIMGSNVCTVAPEDTLDTVIDELDAHHVTTLPVVDGGTVVAMVGEADVIAALVAPDPRSHLRPVHGPRADPARLVRDVMSGPAYTVHPSDDVRDVADTLARHGWKSAAVVDDGVLVGIVSRSDVIRALNRSDDEIARDVRLVLAELGWESWPLTVRDGDVSLSGPHGGHELAAATRAAMGVAGVRHVTYADLP